MKGKLKNDLWQRSSLHAQSDGIMEALFLGTLLESDKDKLTELLQATEQAMVLRVQELLNSSDHHEEHGEMNTALASVLSIKTHKLGWPAVSARDGLS